MKNHGKVLLSLALVGSMLLPYSTAFAAEVTTPGGSANSEVTLTVGDTAPKIFSVTVPSEIPVNIRQDGTVEVAKNLNIRNDSSDAVKVTAISVAGKNGWSVAEYAADFSAKPDNSKVIAMQFRGDGTDSAGDITLTPDNWNIPVSTNLDIQAQVKLAKQTQEASKSNIATVSWSFNWKDAADVPDVPDTSAISHNWQDGTPMLAGSRKDVTFDWSSTADTNSIASVESSEPDVASIDPKAISTLVEGQATYTVTGKSVGNTTITATLNSGESTSFDVTVNEVKPGTGGDGDDIEITIPGDTLKPGDKLDPDIEIEIPVTGPDGDSTITVKPAIPDTELQPGDNEIEVEVDINGVKITIVIKVTVEGGSSNPSDGLVQSIQEAQAMGFTFSSYEDGLQIDSFENKQFKKEINVPEQIGDFKVLKIGDNSFKDQSNLTVVTLPDTVTSVGASAFKGCSSLTAVNIPTQVSRIEANTFEGCAALVLTGIPSAVTYVGNRAFYGCRSLDLSVDSSNMTQIGEYAFYDCSNLGDVTISAEVKTGRNAFSGAGNEDAALTVKGTLGVGARDMQSPYYTSGFGTIVISDEISTLRQYMFQRANATNIVWPDNLSYVSQYAFCNMPKLEKVVIPESVTSIQEYAFSGCENLQTVILENKTRVTIGTDAFSSHTPDPVDNGSYYATTVIYTDAEVKTDDSLRIYPYTGTVFNSDGIVFVNKGTSLSVVDYLGEDDHVSIPAQFSGKNVSVIGTRAFDRSQIAGVTLPETLTSIEDSAFYRCFNLQSVEVPNNVEVIGNEAFRFCSNLTTLTLGSNLKDIGEYAFASCGIAELILPEGVTHIGEYAFYFCENLKTINIPVGITQIPVRMFDHSGLESFNIPSHITEIGFGAFSDCEKLISINIPDSVTSIENYAFDGCSALSIVSIPSSVTSVGGSSAFRDVPHIEYHGSASGAPWGALSMN